MNIWISIAIVVGMLAIGGIVVSALIANDKGNNEETIDCSNCENSCNSQRNCGLSSCGAVSGGSCGCGR